ncbi:MAG: GHKL domain-containing protein [Ruminococcaceae bacterium]|nr:GHKL domain-containing protein [Oscillospiraceae bacterium]
MPDLILGLLHNATTLIFGIFVSAAFLGIRPTRKSILSLSLFSVGSGAILLLSFFFLGEKLTEQIYPLISHLPLILFLALFFKRKLSLSLLSVVTSYLCCQISNWAGLLAIYLSHRLWVYYLVRIIITVVVFVCIMHFVPKMAYQLLQKPTKAIMIFASMPIVYYFFDYITSVYTSLLYSGADVIVEFLGFVLCLSYVLFLFFYFRQYEEKRETERNSQLMAIKYQQSIREIEAMRHSEYTATILRHDLRHFLNNISALIDQGETDKAQEYIHSMIQSADQTVAHRFCQHKTINMILSFHQGQIEKNNITFRHSVQVPDTLPFSDVDLTAILSNGLENAIAAVLPLEPEKRLIELDLRMNGDKLLISIKNTFSAPPRFVDGLPQASEPGHGLGTKSIQYVAEKLHGNCQFTLQNQMFVLRVIL